MKVEDYIPLLASRARSAYYKINPIVPVPFDDCLGEAYVLFCKALQKYDPAREVKFSTYLFSVLKSLENQILITNRMSVNDSFKFPHPVELSPIVVESDTRIHTEELSSDGRQLVTLILDRAVGADYGTGKGKKYPGIRRISQYMHREYGWSYRKTETVISEVKDWWRDQ